MYSGWDCHADSLVCGRIIVFMHALRKVLYRLSRIRLGGSELQAIAEFRGETLEEVTALYTHVVNGDRSLRDKPNTDCIFYDASLGCTVYDARPRQCRTWPFWESTVGTPKAWENTKRACPGAGQGELIPVEEITRRIKVIKL